MNDTDQRLRYAGFTDVDAGSIAAIKPTIEKHAEALTDAFFNHLRPFSDAQRLLGDRTLYEEARKLKRAHLFAMVAGGNYGAAYVEERKRLGAIYSHARLPTALFIGAFGAMTSAASALVTREQGESLRRVAAFEIAIIVDVLVAERERVIRDQQAQLLEMSTPVLQVQPGLLIVPIIGAIDAERSKQLTDNLLRAIRERRARVAVLDVTGVGTVDSRVASSLMRTVSSARLMGATAIVTGIPPDVARSLVTLGVDLSELHALGDLESGVEEAQRLLAARAGTESGGDSGGDVVDEPYG